MLVPGETKDQPSTSRPNTLSDDADDLQRQLDNEVRERLYGQYGRVRKLPIDYGIVLKPLTCQQMNLTSVIKSDRDSRVLKSQTEHTDLVVIWSTDGACQSCRTVIKVLLKLLKVFINIFSFRNYCLQMWSCTVFNYF